MTNFEKITASPEVLGAFLALETAADGPWDKAFQQKYCARCDKVDCDVCPNERQRHNPAWWLRLEADGYGQ